jgi:uncharacterized membrane protein YkoI
MKRRVNIALALLAALAMVMTMSVAAFAGAITDNDAALKKALKNAGLKKSAVKYIDVEYDSEDGVYEVEFTKKSTGKKYDYEIAASTGTIVKKSVDYKYKRNTSHSKIGKKAARKKVAKFSGISYKIVSSGTCRYEYDDRHGTYEVKFTKGNRRYEYDVLAPTGKIIEYEWRVIKK